MPHTVIGRVRSAWMCKPGVVPGVVPGGTVRLHELARQRMLVQGNNSGTGRAYDAWMKEQGVQPAQVIVVSNLVALTGLTVSGLGVSYLPRECLQPMVAAGMLEVIDVTPALPVVPYVAMHKGEHRSALTSSIVMLAQACCDFTRAFQAQMPGDAAAPAVHA
jgi:DNA-binding transcriptional LysR family regulator